MWKKWLKAIPATGILWLLMPVAALAHGDDEVRLNSFFGLSLAIITMAVLVPIGKALIQAIHRGERP